MSTDLLARAPVGAGANFTPNEALRLDAGALAFDVARVLPRPHSAYFAADPGKRRAIAYLAAHRLIGPTDGALLADWSSRRLLERFDPQAPQGFALALKRGAGPWPIGAFQAVRTLLATGEDGAKTLRHLQAIDAETIFKIDALPAGLRVGKIVALLPVVYYADLIERAVRRAYGRNPEAARVRPIAQRLERASSLNTLFVWLIEALGVSRLTPPPIPGTPWLRPIQDVRDIERTALRFQNCLRTRVPMMLRGQAAYFEVLGEEPAVVEVLVSKKGVWRVGEIRGHANDEVSKALMGEILGYLARFGADALGQADQLALELAEAAGW
jgi:hypothetical protein